MRKLLRVQQVAERLELSQSMVYKLIESEKLPHYRIGRAVRIEEGELDAWIDEQKAEVTPEIAFFSKVAKSV